MGFGNTFWGGKCIWKAYPEKPKELLVKLLRAFPQRQRNYERVWSEEIMGAFKLLKMVLNMGANLHPRIPRFCASIPKRLVMKLFKFKFIY